jgi:predicted membrane channel-forming protein YqfA (hemolysin III family)
VAGCRRTQYAEGTPRPKYRGWLHGIATILTLPPVFLCMCLGLIPAAALPAIFSICFTLCCSSTLHLYPFDTRGGWEIARRLDRFSILLINATSYFSPQLAHSAACHPPAWMSWATVVLPNVIGGAFILKGVKGPLVFIGAGIAAVPTTLFWASYDQFLAALSCMALLLYGAGLALHAMQPAEPAEHWGHHEWTHVLVTAGMVPNAVAVLHMAWSCE